MGVCLAKCLLSPAEKAFLWQINKMFDQINHERYCYCLKDDKLSAAEQELFIDVLKTELRESLSQNAALIEMYLTEIEKKSGLDTPGGADVTQQEFVEAIVDASVLYSQHAMQSLIKSLEAKLHHPVSLHSGGGGCCSCFLTQSQKDARAYANAFFDSLSYEGRCCGLSPSCLGDEELSALMDILSEQPLGTIYENIKQELELGQRTSSAGGGKITRNEFTEGIFRAMGAYHRSALRRITARVNDRLVVLSAPPSPTGSKRKTKHKSADATNRFDARQTGVSLV
mmetsp:Transcript_35470/g.74457  ORF Transcript_35470/g.74457 Transcript_35470/m.74457 type:complete len:284 (-) Transcript_35470:490-1341(-)